VKLGRGIRAPGVAPSFVLFACFYEGGCFYFLLFSHIVSIESPSRLKEDLMDLIAGMQSRRMDEQRASLPRLPGLNNANPDILRRLSVEPAGEDAAALPDENFFEMLMRCQVRYFSTFFGPNLYSFLFTNSSLNQFLTFFFLTCRARGWKISAAPCRIHRLGGTGGPPCPTKIFFR
jgi:hypothetical protein